MFYRIGDLPVANARLKQPANHSSSLPDFRSSHVRFRVARRKSVFFRAIPFHRQSTLLSFFLDSSFFHLFARVKGCRSVGGVWTYPVHLFHSPSFYHSPASTALRFMHFISILYPISFLIILHLRPLYRPDHQESL